MTFDARHSVDQSLHHLAQRLDPIIGTKLAPSLSGFPWPTVLSELDKMKGKPPKSYSAADLQSQLRVITERLGKLGFPFDDHTRLVTTLGNELRIVRNRWAHHDDLTTCTHPGPTRYCELGLNQNDAAPGERHQLLTLPTAAVRSGSGWRAG